MFIVAKCHSTDNYPVLGECHLRSTWAEAATLATDLALRDSLLSREEIWAEICNEGYFWHPDGWTVNVGEVEPSSRGPGT